MDPISQANAAQQNVAIYINPPSTLFSLIGDETRRWCNGMFSNNIRKLQPGQGNLSAICNDRGFVSDFIHCFCKTENHFLAVLERPTIAPFMKRFQMYLVLDDIDVEEINYTCFSVLGPNADTTLKKLGLNPPEEQARFEENHILLRVNRGIDGVDVYASGETRDVLLDKARENGVQSMDEEGFELLRIRKRRARSPQEIDDKTLIHNLGLNEQCCAFDKGCYVGQEIINRIDVKGTNNKLIHRFSAKEAVRIGDAIKIGQKIVGKVTSVARDLNGYVALGVIRKAAWENEQFETESGTALFNMDIQSQ